MTQDSLLNPLLTPLTLRRPAFILMDIEGTITDIHFVHQVLFPYSRQHLRTYLAEHIQDDLVKACLLDVEQTLLNEGQPRPADSVERLEMAITTLAHWIDTDRKHPTLKTLQGLIWRRGYETGAYRGHLYPDVPPQLRAWQAQGIPLGIYSSGSVEAQQLLIQYSDHGDCRGLFQAYFDTAVGAKREPNSYQAIANQLKLPPSQILFLSDIAAELAAAKAVGYTVVQVFRDGFTTEKDSTPYAYPEGGFCPRIQQLDHLTWTNEP